VTAGFDDLAAQAALGKYRVATYEPATQAQAREQARGSDEFVFFAGDCLLVEHPTSTDRVGAEQMDALAAALGDCAAQRFAIEGKRLAGGKRLLDRGRGATSRASCCSRASIATALANTRLQVVGCGIRERGKAKRWASSSCRSRAHSAMARN